MDYNPAMRPPTHPKRTTITWWLALVLFLCACTPPIGPVDPPGPATVYVIDRGWHTDIALPLDEIGPPLSVLAQSFPNARFLSFGFGERRYFMAQHPGLGEGLRALLPSQSALLVTALDTTPQTEFGAEHVVALYVSLEGTSAIDATIWHELVKSPDSKPVALASGPSPGSIFYAASGTYDAFDTCNTWTAEVLRIGGLPVSGSGVLFSGQIMDMARSIAARQAAMGGHH